MQCRLVTAYWLIVSAHATLLTMRQRMLRKQVSSKVHDKRCDAWLLCILPETYWTPSGVSGMHPRFISWSGVSARDRVTYMCAQRRGACRHQAAVSGLLRTPNACAVAKGCVHLLAYMMGSGWRTYLGTMRSTLRLAGRTGEWQGGPAYNHIA